MDILLQNLGLAIFLVLLVLGYIFGSLAEKRHYASIVEREKELLHLVLVNVDGRFAEGSVSDTFLVQGNAVISNDYFKRLLAILRNTFGGRVKAYESLVDRSRREAILRMKEQARAQGANMIMNMRLETSTIGNSANKKNQVGSIETLAYGTAILFRRST